MTNLHKVDQLTDKQVFCPFMSFEGYSELSRIPLGVLRAQAERYAYFWPTVKIGKRSYLNVSLINKRALEQDFK